MKNISKRELKERDYNLRRWGGEVKTDVRERGCRDMEWIPPTLINH
jgi:hypothetical protein